MSRNDFNMVSSFIPNNFGKISAFDSLFK